MRLPSFRAARAFRQWLMGPTRQTLPYPKSASRNEFDRSLRELGPRSPFRGLLRCPRGYKIGRRYPLEHLPHLAVLWRAPSPYTPMAG